MWNASKLIKNADDPYKGLLKIFQSAASVSLQATAVIGEIIEPPPNIKISYNGMTLNAQYLWIDEYWLQGHTRHAKGHIVSCTQPRAGGGGDAAYASHNHDIDNDYTDSIIYTDTWHAGDKVLMIPIVGHDGKTAEQFVILAKLKRLDGN